MDLNKISEKVADKLLEDSGYQACFDKTDCLQAISLLLFLLLGENSDFFPVKRCALDKNQIKELYSKALSLLMSAASSLEAKINLDLFTDDFHRIQGIIKEDINIAYLNDPAASSLLEVQTTYPGLLAVSCYRLAHALNNQQIPLIPRIFSEWAHSKTGIDIHPGAKIGSGLFIDHGTGVVIGETTQIGNSVIIYQGVTLGAKHFPLDENGHPIKGIKRHPTVEDNVIIYANTIILGGNTQIGENSTIGGNLFITESIPRNSVVLADSAQIKGSYIINNKK